MKVTMLGTSAALIDTDRGHSAFLITVKDKSYLVDCGHGATRQIARANIDPSTVNVVFLSHLHYDHIADLPYFLISTWICDRKEKPVIYGPEGTKEFLDHSLENGAFAVDIKARAQFPQRRDTMEMIRPEVRDITTGLIFEDENLKVFADYVEHIPREITECFGFRFEAEGKVVTFSSDTAPCESVLNLAKDCDLLIHDCTFPKEALEFRDKVGIGTSAHTSPYDLGIIAKKANVKSVMPTHFAHFDTASPVVKKYLEKHMPIEHVGPDIFESVITDIKENYDGPIHIAEDSMRINL